MVQIGSRAEREIDDVMLTRYACYLIMQPHFPAEEITAISIFEIRWLVILNNDGS